MQRIEPIKDYGYNEANKDKEELKNEEIESTQTLNVSIGLPQVRSGVEHCKLKVLENLVDLLMESKEDNRD